MYTIVYERQVIMIIYKIRYKYKQDTLYRGEDIILSYSVVGYDDLDATIRRDLSNKGWALSTEDGKLYDYIVDDDVVGKYKGFYDELINIRNLIKKEKINKYINLI